jgi:hypothetical protein
MNDFQRRRLFIASVVIVLAATIVFIAFHRILFMSDSANRQKELPRRILPDLLWSMSEPIPASSKEMVRALSAYAANVKGSINLAELETIYPWRSIDIHYTTWVRPSGVGEWTEVKRVIPIRFQHEPAYAEIMFELHKASHAELREDDHHFFEGLEFSNGSTVKEPPVYALILGS